MGATAGMVGESVCELNGGGGVIKKRGKKTEKRGRKNLTLSLKMNEKMGNPRVTA